MKNANKNSKPIKAFENLIIKPLKTEKVKGGNIIVEDTGAI